MHHTQDPKVSQRTIAQALGMSVGLTNAILERMADTGLLMVRRIKQCNAHYLVAPGEIEQVSRRSYRYLRRTQSHAGITEIRLLGESDFTFIPEWCA